jgi:hypothetical protein
MEQRVAALEAAVRELQRQLAAYAGGVNWVQQLTGSFKDEPAFDEVLEYGRQFRSADRPPEEEGP